MILDNAATVVSIANGLLQIGKELGITDAIKERIKNFGKGNKDNAADKFTKEEIDAIKDAVNRFLQESEYRPTYLSGIILYAGFEKEIPDNAKNTIKDVFEEEWDNSGLTDKYAKDDYIIDGNAIYVNIENTYDWTYDSEATDAIAALVHNINESLKDESLGNGGRDLIFTGYRVF